MSAPMIFRVVSLIGTARPRPTPATAVLIPTTWPRPSASAPPELPGLSAASVWMTFSTMRPAARERPERAPERRDDAGRHRAGEAVRVPDGDDELADSELLRVAERRRARDRRRRSGERRDPRAGRRRPPRALTSRPSTKEASHLPSLAATTWAEVSMKPSGVMTTPLPPPTELSGRREPAAKRGGSRPSGRDRSAIVTTAREYASSACRSSTSPEERERQTRPCPVNATGREAGPPREARWPRSRRDATARCSRSR